MFSRRLDGVCVGGNLLDGVYGDGEIPTRGAA